jgi:FAD:protein FMN transferase
MMTINRLAFSVMLAALGARAADPPAPGRAWHVFQHEHVLGTSLELKISAPTAAEAARAEAAALAELDRLAKILSAYDPASEFSRWLETWQKPVPVSPALFEVLGLFDDWRTRSGGALDASAAVACDLWKRAAAWQRLPSEDELGAAVAAAREPHWRLDPALHTATRLSRAPLILNSFVKSYLASRACDAVLASGRIEAAVVNIGGDLVVRGDWTEPVQIVNPRAAEENSEPVARLRVRNRAVATSGTYRRGVQIGGQWFSHIVDPRTARPVDHILSATVVAPEATDAGALATAFCVLAPEASLRLAASLRNVECLLLTKDGRRLTSAGWVQLEGPRVQLASAGPVTGLGPAPSATPPNAGTWDGDFELIVTLEIARQDGRRTARPYLAVWIENQEKVPVRTLALWFNSQRWLPDLRSWQRGDQRRALADGTQIVRSVSGATRAPGRYTLKWDGKDDRGQPVKAGRYTVLIEAVREHGTYQIIRQDMEFAGAPQQAQLKGNVEVNSASLDYRRKDGPP